MPTDVARIYESIAKDATEGYTDGCVHMGGYQIFWNSKFEIQCDNL